MQNLLQADMLLPILYILMGEFVLIMVYIWMLRRMNILKTPYGAMEWSRLICVAAVISGITFSGSSLIEPVFHTYKTLKSQQVIFADLFAKSFQNFSQSFLIVLISALLYMMVFLLIMRSFPGEKSAKNEILTGNIPVAVLVAVVVISFAIIFKLIDDQILNLLVPYVINFH